MNQIHVAFCEDPRCDFLARSVAVDVGKFKATASHHAWAHGHTVKILSSDLELVASFDPAGISAQVPLF